MIYGQTYVNCQKLETIHSFKYFGTILSDEGTKQEMLARCAQTTTALSKLRKISMTTILLFAQKLNSCALLYGCEGWTLNADLKRRNQALEMRCLRKILGISYRDHITNEEVRERIINAIVPFESLLNISQNTIIELVWTCHKI